MRSYITAAVLATATLMFHSAQAGTETPYAFSPIEPLQDTVTYRTTTSNTQLGFSFGRPGTNFISQLSGNTLNRVLLTIDFSVTDAEEKLSFIDPGFYLPSQCTATTAPVEAVAARVVCDFRQTRAGFTLPSFLVFLNAPAKVNNGFADELGEDKVSVTVGIQYAEGANGAASSPVNSTQGGPTASITLGTSDPVDVRTAVSRGGVSLRSGLNGTGVPLNTDNQRHTELVEIPALSSDFTVASIKITKALASDATLDGANCLNAGNLTECPTFETTVGNPFIPNDETLFTVANPLKTTYRIDASTRKRGATQTLNAVELRYNGQLVQACTNGQPNTNGVPCVLDKFCYKNNFSVEALRGDCEWQLINLRNGLIKIQ